MSPRSRWSVSEPRRRLLAAGVMALALPTAARADAVPAHIGRAIENVRLAGRCTLTWFGLHVYDAALFVTDRFDLRQPTAHPFALELTYARRLSGAAIAQRTREEMERLGAASAEQRANWERLLARIFPDVDRGRKITGINRPGAGVRFLVDGADAGAIDEPAFAPAFFAIWLDERTSAAKLRQALLARLPA